MILSQSFKARLNTTRYDIKIAKSMSSATVRANSVRVHKEALPEQQQQQQAFLGLKARAKICLADIVELKPGYKGLVATRNVPAGDTVLELLPCNSLCVPEHGSAYRWECDWLEPFEAAYGTLPDALSYFLADQEVHLLSRLATLILYIKKRTTSSSSSSSSSSFWHAWLQLLPPLDAATYPGANWTAAEIEQLQFQPHMGSMTEESSAYNKWCESLTAYLNTNRALRNLRLAEDVNEVRWALFVAKTRSVGESGSVYIYPLHDFLNHDDIEEANCIPKPSSNSFCIIADTDISAGAELTISYAPPDGYCNLDLLLAWGFTAPTCRQEWALPQTVHLLPPIHYQAAVAAAAAVTMQRCNAPNPREMLSSDLLQSRYYQMVLAAGAAASLPLSLSSSSSSSVAAAVQYQNAVKLLQKFGVNNCTKQQQQQKSDRYNDTSDMLQMTVITGWDEQCKHPDYEQLAANQKKLVADVIDATAVAAAAAAAAHGMPAKENANTWQQQLAIDWLKANMPNHLQQADNSEGIHLQRLAAAAVHHECYLLLLQAGTTVEEDEELLQQLRQEQQQQQQPADPGLAATGEGKEPAATTVSNSNSSSTAGDGTGTASSFRFKRSRGSIFRKATAVTNKITASPASQISSSSSSSNLDNSSTSLDSSHLQKYHLQQFQQMQQAVVQNLTLLQALRVIGSSSSSSGARGSAGQQAAAASMKTAAQLVVKILGQGLPQQQQQQLIAEADDLIRQQRALLLLLLSQQQQQKASRSHEQQLLLSNAALNKARLQTAVAARLERKKLLVLLSELAKHVEIALAGL